jgi:hypothetical protein
VTIENGSIVGVGAGGGTYNQPCDVGVLGDDDVTVKNVAIERCDRGIFLRGSNNTVVRNEIREYASAAGEPYPFVGISIDPPSEGDVSPHNNVISRNVVSNSAAAFPVVQETTIIGIDALTHDSRIDRNVAEGNTYGATVAGHNDVVERNFVTRTRGPAAMFVCLQGSQVARNEVVGDPSWSFESSGISVECSDPSAGALTSVEQNSASGFTNDGIEIRASGVVVSKNRANFNGEYGIEAVPGIVDGGGNKARGNGNPAQCLNVSCN